MPAPPPNLRPVVIDAIAIAAGVAADTIREDTDLGELGLDSLDFSTILIEMEDRLGLEVPAEVLDQLAEVEDVTTVGDVLRLLSRWDPRPADRAPRPHGVIVAGA
jgi:acyl carrier protein